MRRNVLHGCMWLTILAVVVGGIGLAEAGLMNGDFETEDFTGWTSFTTPGGTLGPGFGVASFDTNDDGVATWSARFQVGATSLPVEESVGGGIYQDVSLGAGTLTIEADIASHNIGCCNNPDGGLVEVFVDGVAVASHDFGSIDSGTTEFSSLAGAIQVTAGMHEILFQVRRNALNGPVSPLNFIDNITLSGPATVVMQDTDDDSIPDQEDACPHSDLSPTVSIEDCDSEVENILFVEDGLFGNGCTLSDLIMEIRAQASNRGAFAQGVSHLTNDLKEAGILTDQQKGAIESCIRQANLL
jgi:hypothetical protein